MAEEMISFRRVSLTGPPLDDHQPIWAALVDLGSARNDPLIHNHSMRLLTQKAEPIEAWHDERKLLFHEPLLLQAAVTTRNLNTNPTKVTLLGVPFRPSAAATADDAPLYDNIRVTPDAEWPVTQPPHGETFPPLRRWVIDDATQQYEVSAPRLRVSEGRLRIGYVPGGPLDSLLKLAAEPSDADKRRIFGALTMDLAPLEGGGRGLIFDLVPEGFEFDARIPDPFARPPAVGAATLVMERVRLRLQRVAIENGHELRLMLIGGADVAKLGAGLAALAEDISRGDSPLAMQVAALDAPPLSWTLTKQGGGYTCGAAGAIPAVKVGDEAAIVRVISRSDPAGGSPSVATIVRPRVSLSARPPIAAPVVTITAQPPRAETAPLTGPTLTLGWTDRHRTPDTIELAACTGAVQTSDLAADLQANWRATGALADDAPLRHLFIALETGWIQAPLSTTKPHRHPVDSQVSALAGPLRFDLAPAGLRVTRASERLSYPGLDVLAAGGVEATITVGAPLQIQMTVTTANGEIDGLIWCGLASPTAVDILPSLEAGPAALASLPIAFGGTAATMGWSAALPKITLAGPRTLDVTFEAECDPTTPLILWRPHPSMGLIAAIGMTRTADSATRPSATRELFPAEVVATNQVRTVSITVGASGLPTVDATTRLDGQGGWGWPWPATSARPPLSASPIEAGFVSMVALTLPGIEMAPGAGATSPTDKLVASLRFDLPLLDELFAIAKAPPPPTPAQATPRPVLATPPPTSLDLKALSGVWAESARRLARARTEGDRVVFTQASASAPVIGWHPFNTAVTTGQVPGLVGSWVWKPACFRVAETADDAAALKLGAIALGAATDWLQGCEALSGLTTSFRFDINTGALTLETKAQQAVQDAPRIKVDGFAPSSFDIDPNALHDARGLALAKSATQLARASLRAINNRTLGPDGARSLLTLTSPVPLGLGSQRARFWCRDLPVTRTADGWAFDNRAGLEQASGPDPSALRPANLAHALYEWRLYPEGLTAPGQEAYELPLLAPLALRPLRLLGASFDATGQLTRLLVAGAVLEAVSSAKEGPFAADREYTTGNLVSLEFDASLTLTGLHRLASDPVTGAFAPRPPLAGGLEVPVTFIRRALASLDPLEPGPPVTATLSLSLKAIGGAPVITAATLSARLFGQPCALTASPVPTDASAISFAGLRASDILAIDSVQFKWAQGDTMRLTLAGALRATATHGVSPFLRPFGGDELGDKLYWLGLETSAHESVDHEAGALTLEVQKAPVLEGARLFRGFLLPDGKLSGLIAVTFGSADAGRWPKAACVSAEFAFEASASSDGSKRITALRHRYKAAAQDPGPPVNELTVDARFGEGSVSAVRWPVGRANIALDTFASVPTTPASWARPLTMDGGGPDVVHVVRPRVCAHVFPLNGLFSAQPASSSIDADAIRLTQPWRFRAVTDHSLQPATGQDWNGAAIGTPPPAMAWTTVDEACLWDMRELAQETAFAFESRYRRSSTDNDIPIAGVVRRTLAGVGLPTEALVRAIAANPPSAPTAASPGAALVISGASVLEVLVDPAGRKGLTLTPHWILPWAAANAAALPGALEPLRVIPQYHAGLAIRVAAYDAAAGAPVLLTGDAPIALSVQDGTSSLLEARLADLLGGPLGARIIADQALSELDPPVGLDQPLFLRTLLALKAIIAQADLRRPQQLGLRARCVIPGAQREARLAVTAWPPDYAPDLAAAAPAIQLLVVDGQKIYSAPLPGPLAATLADPNSDDIYQDPRCLAEAGVRALSLTSSPRIIALARVDRTYADTPEARDGVAPHVLWALAPPPRAPLASHDARALQAEDDTVYASAALGWPSASGTASLWASQARLGAEETRRNPDLAWAGRARSLAWPAQARPGPANADETLRDAVYLSLGQRAALRRRAAAGLRAPPDRGAMLAPPRARAPLPEAVSDAFRAITGAAEAPSMAPIVPGGLEITVTGQRPGALITQHESLIFASGAQGFDPDQGRFGRPASRGPVIARQVRAPRSSALALNENDLDRRRATFVATDEKAAGGLKPFKLIAGPSLVLRAYENDLPAAVTFQVLSPKAGWLTADWSGVVRLRAQAAGGDVTGKLAGMGLLPPGGVVTLTAGLRVGDCAIAFDRIAWGADVDATGAPVGAAADIMVIDLRLSDGPRQEVVEAIRAALHAATADTPIQLTLSGGALPDPNPPPPPAPPPPPPPSPSGQAELPATAGGLLFGPPRNLTLSLAHLPSGRRWLPRPICTLVFGDPAYDRELGSPAKTYAATLNGKAYLLGADRADYDLASTLQVALWRKDATPPPIPSAPIQWTLALAVVPSDGSGQRPLRLPPYPTVGPYPISEGLAYAIPLSRLQEKEGGAADLKPGDRMNVSAIPNADLDHALVLDLGLVADPVSPPPAAVYGLATIRNATGIGAPLFASAPLPTLIEFPSLLEDLKAGHVRRRALFVWPHTPPAMPAVGAPYGVLIKGDRTGGGQQPDGTGDFQPIEGLYAVAESGVP